MSRLGFGCLALWCGVCCGVGCAPVSQIHGPSAAIGVTFHIDSDDGGEAITFRAAPRFEVGYSYHHMRSFAGYGASATLAFDTIDGFELSAVGHLFPLTAGLGVNLSVKGELRMRVLAGLDFVPLLRDNACDTKSEPDCEAGEPRFSDVLHPAWLPRSRILASIGVLGGQVPDVNLNFLLGATVDYGFIRTGRRRD